MAYREDLTDLNNGRYDNVLVFLALGVLLFILIRGWNKTKQEVASDNIGSDKNKLLAQQLRQAFMPSGMPVAMGFDGTDTATVLLVANQITDYQSVAVAYRTLYNGDLSNDLAEELNQADLASFWKAVNNKGIAATSTGNTTNNTTGSGITVSVGPETRIASLYNKTCIANQTVNVRLYKEPAYSDHQAKKGENLGVYFGEATLLISGKKYLMAHVRKPAFGGLYYVDYWVLKSAITFV